MSDRSVANGATRFHKPVARFRLHSWNSRRVQRMSSLEADFGGRARDSSPCQFDGESKLGLEGVLMGSSKATTS